MKITKTMVNRAENEHFRKEDRPSLVKMHALKSLYYAQKGDTKSALAYVTSKDVGAKVRQLEKNAKRKPVKRRKSSGIAGTRLRMPRFKF